MAQKKRSFEGENTAGLNDVHTSRKKRVKYTQEDAQLAEIYNNLADEVPSVRIQAAADLLNRLSTKASEQAQSIETAETRLIKGLCSGRKAARLGFSIALAEIFRLSFSEGKEKDGPTLSTIVDKIVNLTASHGNVSGQEKRDHALGRRFAFQALLQSDVGLSKDLSDEQWKYLIKSIFELAHQKQWLRRECGTMLYEYLSSPSAAALEGPKVRAIVDEMIDAKLAKTPEGVGIWITVQQHFPQVKLPKHVWHHRDPLNPKELSVLSKVLLETPLDDGDSAVKSGARQSTPGFAWSAILSQLYERGDSSAFAKFWDSAVASTMFSPKSSTERKSLGLQVLTLAISTAPGSMLPPVLSSKNIITCILDQRTSPERYLFDGANLPLKRMNARVKAEPTAASAFVRAVIDNGTPHFDQLTKTKTIETMISHANEEALEVIVSTILLAIEYHAAADQHEVETVRRTLADLLLTIFKTHHKAEAFILEDSQFSGMYKLSPWAIKTLDNLLSFGYEQKELDTLPSISETSQKTFRQRLMSCIGLCLDRSIDKAVVAPLHVAEGLVLSSPLVRELDERQREAVKLAKEISNGLRQRLSTGPVVHAFQLLFSLSIIQVHNGEADSLAMLEDLILCYQSLEKTNDSSTILIELLLSFISKPSALFRRMAEQVFTVFAPQLTSESMVSLIDILEQKESLSGQKTLFEQHADDEQHLSGSADEDESVMDVEDESDVELVNGHEALAGDQHTAGDSTGSSESSSQAGEGADGEEEDDEVAAFDKKLADALGTAGLADSDDDGSDMDDEQMMALEPHLTSIFQERQKTMSKKSEKKDAKENIVNFKNRVLDLLTIYAKSQSSNVLALDLVLPLTTLIRTTTSKATSEKASTVLKNYYEACNKNKAWPRPDDPTLCFDILKDVHTELKLGGSKLHTNACSRASLFLSKVLVGLDQAHYEQIAELYFKLQSEWYMDAKSRLPGSVFTEWTSWSINTRKQL